MTGSFLAVDAALRQRAEEDRPVRVGLVGAGFMARGIARQLRGAVPGLRLAAIANRTPERARDVLAHAGFPESRAVDDADALRRAIEAGVPAWTGDDALLTACEEVDVLVEATGAVEFGAHVVSRAIDHGTDVVSLNVELDATVGALLQERAQAQGVLLTGADGDQPGAQLNLARWVRGLGLEPLVCGNVKGLQDHYRTPETQASFAAQWNQTPEMVTSFADGTKISFEQALVANALDLGLAAPGMLGLEHEGRLDDLPARFLEAVPLEELRRHGGIVDYVLGAKPNGGVFVLAANPDPAQEVYLRYGKLGDGPLYAFYVPQHLTALEVPQSVARAALLRDPVVRPRVAPPRVEVVACAKRDLAAGEVLDGLGGFDTYGTCERAETVSERGLLPIGIAEGARLRRAVPRDGALAREDVELPQERLSVRLRAEQDRRFAPRAEARPA